ncbi:MAG: tripartite tricarboxylate transporter substrate binding protein [candidate division WOR-3 bacterium]
MSRNIYYVTCPKCKGEFYVSKSFFEVRGAMCYCPFCTREFSVQADKKTPRKASLGRTASIIVALMAVGLLLRYATVSFAQQYPTKPVTLTVGMAAGGVTDLATRTIAEESKKLLKQDFLVVNKPGAGQTVAMSTVITSKPDGYTLGATTDAPYTRGPNLFKLNFSPLADTTPIILYATFRSVIIVRDDSPFKSLNDMFDYARKNPGRLTYGHPGLGTSTYMGFGGACLHLGLNVSQVPFVGDSAALTALLGGHVMAAVMGSSSCMAQIKAGKVRVLGVVEGKERMKEYPDAPNLYEYAPQETLSPPSLLVFGPKGLADPIVKILQDTVNKARDSDTFRKFARENEVFLPKEPLVGQALRDYLERESKNTAEVIRKLGIPKADASK